MARRFGWTKNVLVHQIENQTPIGVAAYRIVSSLPAELRGQLPAPEQVARLLEAVGA